MDDIKRAVIWGVLAATLASCAAQTQEVRFEEQSDFHLQLAYGHWGGSEVPQAIEELQMALAIDADNAEAHYMLGFIYSGRQMLSEAIQHYRQALLLVPDWYDCMNNLGVVFLQLERWDEAAELFVQLTAVASYHTPGHAYNNLGWSQLNMNQPREALSNFEMASYLQPDLCLAYNNQGLAQEELTREREAVDAYETAVELCPDYAEPHFNLGRILQQQGRFDEAYALFNECSTLTPTRGNLGRRCQEYLHDYQ